MISSKGKINMLALDRQHSLPPSPHLCVCPTVVHCGVSLAKAGLASSVIGSLGDVNQNVIRPLGLGHWLECKATVVNSNSSAQRWYHKCIFFFFSLKPSCQRLYSKMSPWLLHYQGSRGGGWKSNKTKCQRVRIKTESEFYLELILCQSADMFLSREAILIKAT